MARFDFDLEEQEDLQDFSVMPEGEYRLKATEAENKETSTGGEMIAATFTVVEPSEHKGRKVWANFNIVNKSEKAQNFGRRMVAGWARACGKPNAKDTDQLLEKPFWCKLGIEEGTGQYKDKNIISSFLMPEGVKPDPKSAPEKESVSTPPVKEEKTAKQEPVLESPSKATVSGGVKKPWDD